jgi:uncharacterized membrane protein YoaK (UPF0700 family)
MAHNGASTNEAETMPSSALQLVNNDSKPHQQLQAIDEPPSKRGPWPWLNDSIREDMYLEIQLLLLAFGTGIQDACTYPDYSCFTSNQTGNTVLLAIGVSGLAPNAFSFQNIAISLSLFILGGWVAGQTGNAVGPRRRLWLLLSSLLQTAMVWAAVAIQYTVPVRKSGAASYVVLSLLAFSSAAQVAMARSLKITEITTAMATAAYVDLLIDPNLYGPKNRSRNRRAIFLVMLAGGSFAGAFANRAVDSAFALMIAAAIKTVAMIGLVFNKPMRQEELEKMARDEILMLG